MNRISKEIDEAYSDYQKEYGRVPNVAFVRIRWRNDSEQAAYIETIALDKTYFRHDDDDIFYYCESVDELKELTSEYSRADFRVTSFISFDRF